MEIKKLQKGSSSLAIIIVLFAVFSFFASHNYSNKPLKQAEQTINPSITIISPGAGENITGVYKIKWNLSGDMSQVKTLDLWLLKNGKEIGWVSNNLGIDFSSGSYMWDGEYTDPTSRLRKIPDAGSDYKIGAYLRGSFDKEISHSESNNFSIGLPAHSDSLMTIISPNGGENWKIGNTYAISWDSHDLASKDLLYVYLKDKNDRTVLVITKDSIPSSMKSYTWTIPSTVTPGFYKIEVWCDRYTPSVGADAESLDYFNIVSSN